MYYISLDPNDTNKLVYYCRNCGHIENDDVKNDTNIFIVQNNLKKKENKFAHIINQYTKLDPTLPRVNNVLCPNDDCLTNTDPDNNLREIIIMRYDDKNMKYVSLCSTCDTVWKTEEHK